MSDWDAQTYHNLSDPQVEWGRRVLARLNPIPGERILDLGCGSGRLTIELASALGQGQIVALDRSPSMLAEAAVRLSERVPPPGPRPAGSRGVDIHLVRGDGSHLPFVDAFDAVFSTATFHWIGDHDRLFSRLRAMLMPGGPLVAQCGGEGNVAEWVAATERASARAEFAAAFSGWPRPWNFAGPDSTVRRLEAAGFTDASCRLEEKVVEPDDPRDFVAAVGLAAHHEQLPAELREPFTDAVLDELSDPLVLRYVRLNIDARAAG